MALVEAAVYRKPVKYEDWTQPVLKRARFLGAQNRTIVQMVVEQKLSLYAISKLLQVQPSTIGRKVRKLLERLRDPMVVALVENRGSLPDEYRQIGIEHFLQGMSGPQLADRHQMSAYQVRRIIEYLKVWREGMAGWMK